MLLQSAASVGIAATSVASALACAGNLYGGRSAAHVWWYGWVTALSTGLGALPMLIARDLSEWWVGLADALAVRATSRPRDSLAARHAPTGRLACRACAVSRTQAGSMRATRGLRFRSVCRFPDRRPRHRAAPCACVPLVAQGGMMTAASACLVSEALELPSEARTGLTALQGVVYAHSLTNAPTLPPTQRTLPTAHVHPRHAQSSPSLLSSPRAAAPPPPTLCLVATWSPMVFGRRASDDTPAPSHTHAHA